MTRTARLFTNGGSQAVRLPKEFRFEGEEVGVKRVGSAVLLFAPGSAWELMADALGRADEDFMVERAQPAEAEARRRL